VLSQVWGCLSQQCRPAELTFVPAALFCCRILGTFAAALQAGIGNVAAGSLFAAAQAATMGGGIPVLFSIIGGVVTGVLGVAAAAFAWAFGSKGAK